MDPPLLTARPMGHVCRTGQGRLNSFSKQITPRSSKGGLISENSFLFTAIARFPVSAFLRLEPPLASDFNHCTIDLKLIQKFRYTLA